MKQTSARVRVSSLHFCRLPVAALKTRRLVWEVKNHGAQTGVQSERRHLAAAPAWVAALPRLQSQSPNFKRGRRCCHLAA